MRREITSLRSEKTILLAIAIQLFIAAFSSFLVVGLVSMYDPTGVGAPETEIAITGEDPSSLIAVANQQSGLEITVVQDPAVAQASFQSGEVDAVLEATRNSDGQLLIDATLPDEGLQTTLLVVQVRETLEALEQTERLAMSDRLTEEPLLVPNQIDASPYVSFIYTILLPLLLFLPAFISGSIIVDSLSEERQRGTLELLRVAPLSFVDVVDAKLLAVTALAPIQAIAWLVLLVLNGTQIANPVALVVMVAALSLLVAAVGAGVALTAPDRRQAQLLYSVGLVGALVVASLLPEHPANTVAKFAIGSATATTWLLLAGYCLLAILAVGVLRTGVDRLAAERL